MQVTSEYPGDAATGGCYLSGRARSEIIDDPNQPARPERVIVTDTYIDHEGRVCVGEITVRHMAHLLGMYHGEQVEAIAHENEALRAEVDAQRAELLAVREELAEAQDSIEKVYVDANGNTYTTLEAAQAMSAPEPAPPVPVEDQGLNDVHPDAIPPAPVMPDESAAPQAPDAPADPEPSSVPDPVEPDPASNVGDADPAESTVELGSAPVDGSDGGVESVEPPADPTSEQSVSPGDGASEAPVTSGDTAVVPPETPDAVDGVPEPDPAETSVPEIPDALPDGESPDPAEAPAAPDEPVVDRPVDSPVVEDPVGTLEADGPQPGTAITDAPVEPEAQPIDENGNPILPPSGNGVTP